MNIRTLLLVSLLGLSVPALADLEIVDKAHEVRVADLRLPGNIHGTLSFKSCRDCPWRTLRVTEATIYKANGQDVGLEDFRKALGRVAEPRNKHLTVLQHLETNTIIGVYITF